MKPLKPFLQRNAACAAGLRPTESPLIYAVDDEPELTGLYTTLLEASGYCVRTFNNRAEVVAALRMDRRKPELLIRIISAIRCRSKGSCVIAWMFIPRSGS